MSRPTVRTDVKGPPDTRLMGIQMTREGHIIPITEGIAEYWECWEKQKSTVTKHVFESLPGPQGMEPC